MMLFGARTQNSVYTQEEPASPLACTWQIQLCNPNLPEGARCTPMGPESDVQSEMKNMFLDEASAQRVQWSLTTSWGLGNDMYTVASSLNARSLPARKSLLAKMQGPIAENQWQLDSKHPFHHICFYNLPINPYPSPLSPICLNSVSNCYCYSAILV